MISAPITSSEFPFVKPTQIQTLPLLLLAFEPQPFVLALPGMQGWAWASKPSGKTTGSPLAGGEELAGMDVVEVSPPFYQAEVTAAAAHRCVLEAISALAAKRRDGGAAPIARLGAGTDSSGGG